MAIAAVLVVAIGSFVFARRSGPPDLRVSARVSGTPTPTPQRAEQASDGGRRTNFLGSGSWTLSSLPSCFVERERLRGPTVRLRAKFPPPDARLRPASVVSAGDCRIVVGRHDLWISRGDDRLRVPPEAALYHDAGGITLVYINGSHAEIRRY